MRNILYSLHLFVLLAMMTGCVTSHMVSVSTSGPINSYRKRGGVYYVQNCDERLKTELLRINKPDGNPMFVANHTDYAVPISIILSNNWNDAGGIITGISTFNNFISGCSLCIWPWLDNSVKECNLEIKSCGFSRVITIESTHRAWSSFIVPLAAIPVIGWADSRKCDTDSIFLHDRCNLPALDYRVVALGVAKNLSFDDYTFIKRNINEEINQQKIDQAKQEYLRSVDEWLVLDYFGKQEEEIRSFSFAECPHVWECIQNLRAELAVQDEYVKEMEKQLKKMDIVPRQSSEYISVCRERYLIVCQLKELYNNLKKTFLEYETYKTTYGKNKMRNLNKTSQNGTQESDGTREVFHYLRKNK